MKKNNFVTGATEKMNKAKLFLATGYISAMCSFNAYADTDAEAFAGTAIDWFFNLLAMGIGAWGGIEFIMAATKFSNAFRDKNGSDMSDAAGAIAAALIKVAIAVAVAMLKEPLKGLMGI